MRQFIVPTILKLIAAYRFSICGLKAAFKDEFAFRLELLISALALPVALFLVNTAIERVLLIGSLFLVIVVELLNSAIETTLNRIDRSWNPLTKKAKDMGSAAVLIAIINAVIIWLVIIIPHPR